MHIYPGSEWEAMQSAQGVTKPTAPGGQTGLTPLGTLGASEGTGVSTHQLPICPVSPPKGIHSPGLPCPRGQEPSGTVAGIGRGLPRSPGQAPRVSSRVSVPCHRTKQSNHQRAGEDRGPAPASYPLPPRESTSSRPHLVQVCSELTFSERPSTPCPSLPRPAPCQLSIFFHRRVIYSITICKTSCQPVPHTSADNRLPGHSADPSLDIQRSWSVLPGTGHASRRFYGDYSVICRSWKWMLRPRDRVPHLSLGQIPKLMAKPAEMHHSTFSVSEGK